MNFSKDRESRLPANGMFQSFVQRHFGGLTMHTQSGTGRSTLAICISFALLILILIPGTRLIAQTDSGRIQGSVTDQTGAVIPGASIILTNTETNATQVISSDQAGNFTVAAIPRGNYKAQVKAPGFASQTQSFTLAVSQVQALNFKLSAGATDTVVEVTSAAPLVDAGTSSI